MTSGERPCCAACGEVIGVYEPLRWRRPDGTLAHGGWLTLAAEPAGAGSVDGLYHAACLDRDPGDRGLL